MSVPLPEITHAQAVALAHLAKGPKSGPTLQGALELDLGQRSGPSFYQLMGRLEANGLVRKTHRKADRGGQVTTECVYTLREDGEVCLAYARHFYHLVGRLAENGGAL